MKPTISTSLRLEVLEVAGCTMDGRAPFTPTQQDGDDPPYERLVESGLIRAFESTSDGQTSGHLASPSMTPEASEASCTTIDFEGVGDLQPIGSLADATFGSSWHGLVDQDDGGSGPFANEPSPSTIALQLAEAVEKRNA